MQKTTKNTVKLPMHNHPPSLPPGAKMFKTIAASKMIKHTPMGTVIHKISCLRPSLLLSKAPVKLETAMTMLRKRVLSNKSL